MILMQQTKKREVDPKDFHLSLTNRISQTTDFRSNSDVNMNSSMDEARTIPSIIQGRRKSNQAKSGQAKSSLGMPSQTVSNKTASNTVLSNKSGA